jgi:hypothetical protein
MNTGHMFYYKNEGRSEMGKNFFALFLGVLMVFGFILLGCDTGDNDNNGTATGELKIYGLESHVNKFVGVNTARTDTTHMGLTINKLADGRFEQNHQIKASTVTLQLYDIEGWDRKTATEYPEKYSGSGTKTIQVTIAGNVEGSEWIESRIFPDTTVKNGCAEITWSDGEVYQRP